MLEKIFQYLPYSNFFANKQPEEVIDKKFQIMSQASLSREDKIQRLSTVNQFDYNDTFNPNNGADRFAHSFRNSLGMTLQDNKPMRIKEYRELSHSYTVKTALLEICNEFIAKDDKTNEILDLDLKDCPDETVNKIKDEFNSFLKTTFDLEKNGFRDIWSILTEGELFFENIISVQKPEMGILGLTKIDSSRIDPIYFDVENELLDHYQLKKRVATDRNQTNNYQQSTNISSNLILGKNQVTYVCSNEWDMQKRFRLPLIENVRMVHRKYQFVEDACVIYMITRAPDRLLFKIPVGTQDPMKVERTMQNAIARLNNKKTLGWDGKVENTYDPQHITENYYLPVMGGNVPNPDITSVQGGTQIPAVMEILTFFQKEIYKHLQIPISRIDTATQFSDGTDITRDELKFAFFIERLQKMYADAIKKSFIIHLKLKNKKLNLFESINYEKEVFWEKWDEIQKTFELQKKYKLAEKYEQMRFLVEKKEELKIRKKHILTEGVEADLEKMLLDSEIDQLVESAQLIKNEVDEINRSSKSIWETFELKEEDIMVRFNLGSSFQSLRSQQKFQIAVDNLSNLSQNPLISFSYLLKTIMKWDDEQILANNAWRIKDAERTWEISNIEQSGPDFRNVAAQGEGGGMEGGGGGAPGGPGLGGGGGGAPSGEPELANLQDPNAAPAGGGGNVAASAEGGGNTPAPSGGNAAPAEK